MTTAIEEAIHRTFDYVIVGGGTAGLALAFRLSADPSTSVIVLEAGVVHEENDPSIVISGQIKPNFGNPKYDYSYKTVPQVHSNNVQFPWSRGKGLGGSSLINLQMWIPPPPQDIDAIEALGNPGWGWNDYVKYQNRATEQVKIANARSSEVINRIYFDTLNGLGLKENIDAYNGNIVGGPFIARCTIDEKTWRRSSSAAAYYIPVKDRSNLTVVAEATVARVLFDHKVHGGDLTAIGAEFVHSGNTYLAKSNKEVILTAGAIVSPQILELSGIGQRDVLGKIGVEVKVELPGVGENIQEHTSFNLVYETVPDKSFETLDLLQDPEYVEEGLKRYAEGKGMPTVHPTTWLYLPLSTLNPEGAKDVIADVEKEVNALKQSVTFPPGRVEQYDIQLRGLRNPEIPDCQIICWPGHIRVGAPPEPGKTYLSLSCVINHPFSRGSIHAKSLDPSEHPEINPNYNDLNYDLEIMAQHITFVRKLVTQEPLKSALVKEHAPGPEYTGAKLMDFVKENLMTVWHTVGSCSMMPRGKNGVVSPQLVVYGTKNLRVADLSIIPLHVATHTQSVAYTVAEKAADLILGL